MAKSKGHVEHLKGGRETGSKMLPGQPVQDAPSKGTIPPPLNRREEYSNLDDATLVRTLNTVYSGLAMAVTHGGQRYGGPPALTGDDFDFISLTLHKVAIAAGWIAKQESRDWLEYDHGFADLLGGDNGDLVEKPYKEWFLGLVADTLTNLESAAEKSLAALYEYKNHLGEQQMAWLQAKGEELRAAETKPSAKDKIVEYRKKVKKPGLRTFEAIAKSATNRSKAAGDNIAVTRISVSRIYNGRGKVGPAVRQAVANLINEQVPCTEEDLLPSKTPPSRRSTPRDPADSTKK